MKARLEAIADLEPHTPRAPAPAFWVLLDGLDEVVASDPHLPSILLDLAVPGTVWLLAGRPEQGLSDAFVPPQCESVFADGLPPMSEADIRAMLLEGLGPARYRLLARDEDEDERVQNAFVDRVCQNARGLPLYVHLLVEDLAAGRLTVNDEDRLPDGLTAYYDALVERLGVSTVRADLTDIVCVLARADEPLDIAGLAFVLGGPARLERYVPRVTAAVRAGGPLLRRAPTSETADGWTLYHQSFREYVGGTSPAESLAAKVADAEEWLCAAAAAWDDERDELAAIRNHLFRRGADYCLRWLGDRGIDAAHGRLVDFAYLMARLEALPVDDVTELVLELERLLAALDGDERQRPFGLWEAFFRERAHLLRRGSPCWPANRILLQAAVEHADDSPVTAAAEQWLESGACDWDWLRRARRVATATISPCLRVLEGHGDWIRGAIVLAPDHIASYVDEEVRVWELSSGRCVSVMEPDDGDVTELLALADGHRLLIRTEDGMGLWDPFTGEQVAALEGHEADINGVAAHDVGRGFVSWSDDGTIRWWSSDTGACLGVLRGAEDEVDGALVLPGGRLLSWDYGDLRVWDLQTGEPTVAMEYDRDVDDALTLPGRPDTVVTRSGCWWLHAHDVVTGAVVRRWEHDTSGPTLEGAVALGTSRLASWTRDAGDLALWDVDADEGPAALLKGHTQGIQGAVALCDDRLLTWSWDRTARLWDAEGQCVAIVAEDEEVTGGVRIDDTRWVSWGESNALHIRDLRTGEPVASLDGHGHWIQGVLQTPEGLVVSWSADGSLRVWDVSRAEQQPSLEGHRDWVFGVLRPDADRVLSWSSDSDLRLWDLRSGDCLSVLRGHRDGVATVLPLPEGRVLSCAGDPDIRIWNLATTECEGRLTGHTGDVNGLLPVPGNRVVSWSADTTARLWDVERGVEVACFEGHSEPVRGAVFTPDGGLLTWSKDDDLRLFDLESGEPRAVMTGHRQPPYGAMALSGGRLLSWSRDKTLIVWAPDGRAIHTLRGHRMVVSGALDLSDGRILSQSFDHTMRTWAADSVEALTVFEGHTELVNDAVLIDSERLLSWAGDATLRLWNVDSGEPLGCWPVAEAAFRAPDIWRHYAARRVGAGVRPGPRADGVMVPSLHVAFDGGPVASWHGDGFWFDPLLPCDGVVVAYGGREVAFLQRWRGNRRVWT